MLHMSRDMGSRYQFQFADRLLEAQYHRISHTITQYPHYHYIYTISSPTTHRNSIKIHVHIENKLQMNPIDAF
jgi:hypothetical protein